jgi:hypothetical protein
MEECQQKISEIVDANGGRVLYADMMKEVPGELRKFVPAALRQMKAAGTMRKQNRHDEDGVNFYVFRPGK